MLVGYLTDEEKREERRGSKGSSVSEGLGYKPNWRVVGAGLGASLLCVCVNAPFRLRDRQTRNRRRRAVERFQSLKHSS